MSQEPKWLRTREGSDRLGSNKSFLGKSHGEVSDPNMAGSLNGPGFWFTPFFMGGILIWLN